MLKVQKLNWDTVFFGLSVGRLDISETTFSIRTSDIQNLKSDFDLIYIFSDREIKGDVFSFEDCKVVLSHKVDSLFPEISQVVSYAGAINESLLSLALQSGEFSRFKLDPMFNDNDFYQLYEQWLKSSLKRIIADEVFVINNFQDIPIGFVTVTKRESYCEIGLLAVNSNCRGQGIGKKLIQKVVNYTVDQGYKELRVPTQKRNVEALKFYNAMNFSVIEETYIYHYWL